MRIRITNRYSDSHLGRVVARGETLEIPEARAIEIIKAGRAEKVEDAAPNTKTVEVAETETPKAKTAKNRKKS